MSKKLATGARKAAMAGKRSTSKRELAEAGKRVTKRVGASPSARGRDVTRPRGKG